MPELNSYLLIPKYEKKAFSNVTLGKCPKSIMSPREYSAEYFFKGKLRRIKCVYSRNLNVYAPFFLNGK